MEVVIYVWKLCFTCGSCGLCVEAVFYIWKWWFMCESGDLCVEVVVYVWNQWFTCGSGGLGCSSVFLSSIFQQMSYTSRLIITGGGVGQGSISHHVHLCLSLLCAV